MSKPRTSAKDRESQGVRTGILGLMLAGVGVFENVPRMALLGLLVAVIGGIMWGAGMARSD